MACVVRLRRLNEVRELSIGFRVFVENMIKSAKADEGMAAYASTPPSKAFNQLLQELNSCVEGYEEACRYAHVLSRANRRFFSHSSSSLICPF